MKTDLEIPLTDAQACDKYQTTKHSCTCGDFVHRRGNYTIYGVKVCKHIVYRMFEELRNDYANRIGVNPVELVDHTCTHNQLKKALGQPSVVELPFQGHSVTLGNGKTFTRR